MQDDVGAHRTVVRRAGRRVRRARRRLRRRHVGLAGDVRRPPGLAGPLPRRRRRGLRRDRRRRAPARSCGGSTWSSPRRRRWSGSASRAIGGRHGRPGRPRGGAAGCPRARRRSTARTRTPTATSTTTTSRRPREEVTRTDGGFLVPARVGRRHRLRRRAPVLLERRDVGRPARSTASRTRVQAFYFANRFHDHLAAAPIGFDAAAGAFQGADRLQLNTLDGASTGPTPTTSTTRTCSRRPTARRRSCRCTCGARRFRNISSGSDAAILYHEYTHGLSNRLVTDADGYGALNTAQAGAMGEGWSDWYAQDFIVGQFPALDTGASGEVVDGRVHGLGLVAAAHASRWTARSSAPTRSPARARPSLGSGGYTYGDFGRDRGGAEVHADGEIWAQTLWDLRTAVGSAKARALVTTGMALLPPEPSFLDARNGILLADQTLYGGADLDDAVGRVRRRAAWASSRRRFDGEDTAPAESFALPPAAGRPDGHDHRPRDRATRRRGRVAGVTVGLAGGLSTYSATTGADGRYTIAGVPEGTYLKARASGAGYDSAVSSLSVTGGDDARTSARCSSATGPPRAAARRSPTATAASTPTTAAARTPPSTRSLATGWSTDAASDKSMVVQLPAAITVTQFGLDPAETCGDAAGSATAGYRVETSPDGTTWTSPAPAPSPSANRHQLNYVTPDRRRDRRPLRPPDAAVLPGRRARRSATCPSSASTARPAPRRHHRAGRPRSCRAADAVRVHLQRAGVDVRVPGRRGRVRGVHVAVHAGGRRRRAHVRGARDRRGGQRRPDARERGRSRSTRSRPRRRSRRADRLDARSTPQFAFASNEPGTIRVPVDVGGFEACTSPRELGPLADGDAHVPGAGHRRGRQRRTPASRTFTVDTTPPDTTITSGPSPFRFSSDRGRADVRVQARRRRVRGLHLAVHARRARRRRAHVQRARDRRGRERGPDPGHADASRVDTTPPETTITGGAEPVHVLSRARPPRRSSARSTTAPFAACTSPARRDVRRREHTFSRPRHGRRGQRRPRAREPDLHGRHGRAGDHDQHRPGRR